MDESLPRVSIFDAENSNSALTQILSFICYCGAPDSLLVSGQLSRVTLDANGT